MLETPRILSYPSLGIDIETTGLDPHTQRCVCIQIANGIDNTVDVIDLRADNFQDFFNSLNVYPGRVYIQTAEFDLRFIYKYYGNCLYLNLFDTMLAEIIILASKQLSGWSLNAIAQKYLDIELDKSVRSEFILPMFAMMKLSETQIKYAAMDAWVLPRIGELQEKELKETNQWKIAELEFQVVPAVAKAELRGFLLDAEKWTGIYEKELKTSREKADELRTLSGIKTLNPNSEKQVIAAMNRLGIKVPEFKDRLTTGETFICRIKHPFITALRTYRSAAKRASTYGKDFLQNVNPVTGRIHTQFNQIGAETGRFSSESPNLQNIPRARAFRECFVASPGMKIISADFSSQEIAVMAQASGDPELIKIFREGLDRHTSVAADIYKVPYDEVTDEQRKAAKIVNFGVAYGSSAWNIANNLNIPQDHAEKLLQDYWRVFTVLQKWQRRSGLLAWVKGYSQTFWGRRRYYEGLEKRRVMRMGANMEIQGTSADMSKLATVLVDTYLWDNFNFIPIINFVHDEIEIEVPEADAVEISTRVKELMETAGAEFVQIVKQEAHVDTGDYWL